MSPQEIDEKNRIIAKFKGWFEEGATGSWYVIDGCGKYVAFSTYKEPYRDLPFHRSWEWLMPVVLKIQELSGEYDAKKLNFVFGYLSQNKNYYCRLEHQQHRHGSKKFSAISTESQIECVWKVVVQFIEWYEKCL